MSFVFDVDKAIQELSGESSETVTAANSANPANQRNQISNFSNEPVSNIDWDERPDPATATEPFNQHHMDAIKAGHQVPVWCGTLNEWTYWVRDEHTKEKLRNKGCTLPIYTLGELCVVERMPKEDIRRIHEIKQAFDGTLTQGGVITRETDPV